ncbi:MAG: small multi-drug export protein [Stomatobaculum sp.]|nr:small multi-drug export protein [Stomatobaculum sp.]
MESITTWFAVNLGDKISPEAVVFLVSLMPILECRGGLLAASLLNVDLWTAIPICILGNILPIPFILLFIRRIFGFLKRFELFRPAIEYLERRGEHKTKALANGEFLGLLLFVGIPLPGTGGWTGSLAASLMEMKFSKAIVAIFLGILMATVIMSIVSYGLLGMIIR